MRAAALVMTALFALLGQGCSGDADDGRGAALSSGRSSSAGDTRGSSAGAGQGLAPLEWPSSGAVSDAGSTGSAARGEALFQRGESVSGQPITAAVGPGDVLVPASSLPCAGCHGKDGRGRSEGGVSPPAVRWDALTRPYEVTAALGRRRGPYSAPLFVRAVTMGVDASGNRLDPVMPRYRLSREDAADLAAYLRTLERAAEPGLADAEVHIGGLFAPDAAGKAAHAAVAALFEEINARQGIFGRRLVLDVASADKGASDKGASDKAAPAKVPFARVGVVDSEALARALEDGVPAVIAASDAALAPAGEGLFVLHGGLAEEAESLLALAAQRAPKGGDALVLRGPGEAAEKAARRVVDGCARAGFTRCATAPPGELPTREALSDARTTAVFLLGWTGDAAPLRDAIARIPGAPLIFVAGGLGAFEASDAPRALLAGAPRSFGGRLFLSAWPAEDASVTVPEYDALAAGHGLSRQHLSAQRRALSAASVLIEGLRRSGRDATREAWIRSIEGIRDHSAWIGPPLSFGRSRHVGAAPPVFSVEPGGHLSPAPDPAPLL
ncbi:MAG: ABC transporter substrate-binding protein [Polyangiaceae bacterium]